MSDYPKRINKLLNELLREAYERELHSALTKLDKDFAEWRNGTIGSGELSYRIHQYETGPSRMLFRKYNEGPKDMNVAYAIVAGILKEDQVPAELKDAISNPLAFYSALKQQGELRMPE